LAQDKVRTLEFGEYRKYDVSTEPVGIQSLNLGDKPFSIETGVVGGPDWLRELSLTLKNISGKNIVECELNLLIPPRGIKAERKLIVFGFPSPSILDLAEKDSTRQLLLWKPEQTIRIKIPDSQVRILDSLRRDGITDIETASLAIYRVRFSDGTGWIQGVPTREDPNRPGSMIPVNRPAISNRTRIESFFENLHPLGVSIIRFIPKFPLQAGFFVEDNLHRTSASILFIANEDVRCC